MSIYVNKLAVTEFDAMVKGEYQAVGFLLRDTMQQRRNVTGSQIRFQKMGAGLARQKAPQDNVTPMNTDYTPVLATMQDWYAADYSDIFKQQEVNFDEKTALAKSIGMAIGRRMDQIAIDALNASGTANVISEASNGFTFEKLLQIIEFMDKKGVPANVGRRFLAISAKAQTDLLKEERLTSSLFVRDQAIARGGINGLELMGLKVIVIPDMDEGGLPLAGGVRKCFAWHEFAAGYATGIDFKTSIDWIAEKRSFLVCGDYKACATAIDNKGIVEIDIAEAA